MTELIPPAPLMFDPELAPVGVEVRFVNFLADRPLLKVVPRLLLVHTNGASGEGSVDSAWNWAHAKPNQNTCPHYQLDRTHDGVTRARKMLPTNRKGIGNATVASAQEGRGSVANWSLLVESADPGYGPGKPGQTAGFDDGQGELLATILAYESILHGIPLEYPTEWHGAGTACHTEPFEYPHWTLYRGKVCPGSTKKLNMREWILPRARQIVAAWTAPIPTPEVDDMKLYIAKDDGKGFLVMIGDGIHSRRVRSAQLDEVHAIIRAGRGPAYYNVLTEQRVTDPADIPAVSADMLLVLGYELEESTP